MSIRIIIADDHSIFIDGMKALLKEAGDMEVVGQALNGKELLEQSALLQPDVVLTDLQMPGMDGIEATRELQKRFPRIRVMALTMMNESLYIRKMLDAGAAGYILKTTDKEELIAGIRKVAGGEKYFNAEVTSRLLNNFPAAPMHRKRCSIPSPAVKKRSWC